MWRNGTVWRIRNFQEGTCGGLLGNSEVPSTVIDVDTWNSIGGVLCVTRTFRYFIRGHVVDGWKIP